MPTCQTDLDDENQQFHSFTDSGFIFTITHEIIDTYISIIKTLEG